MHEPRHFECIVVGGGPTGLAAAATLASGGVDVAIASAYPIESLHESQADTPREPRTAALFPPAIALIDNLGAWAAIAEHCAAITAIRIVDDCGRLLRAPTVTFHAADLDRAELARNVPNGMLARALAASVLRLGATVIRDGRVAAVNPGSSDVRVDLADGRRLHAPLVIAADGRNSIARDAAGIGVRRWSYDQVALATSFRHTRPHGGCSTELHRPSGPCTTVPLPGNASSLVWMDRPAEVERLCNLPQEQFLAELSQRLGGLLGSLSDLGGRGTFRLEGLVASPMAARRIALVGETAHAMPPIGAQGLNLGLADVAVLAEMVLDTRKIGGDPGCEGLLRAYHKARMGDVTRRVGAVDMLDRSLEPAMLPLGLARGIGLHALAASRTLRRRLMMEGLYPKGRLPRSMREARPEGDASARPNGPGAEASRPH